jgi:DNA polymerase-1
MSFNFLINDKNLGKINVHYIDFKGLDEALLLHKQTILGYDVETTHAKEYETDLSAGLDPFRSRLRLIQFAVKTNDGYEAYLFDNFKIPKGTRRALVKILESDSVKVAYNAKFDIKMSRQHLKVKRFGKVFCGELGYRHTKCGQVTYRQSLGKVVLDILGFTLEKELQLSNWSGDLTQEQLEYAAIDAVVVLPLREALVKEIKSLGMVYPAKLDFDILDPIASMELAGFYLNPDKWIQVDENMQARRLVVMEQIIDLFREQGAIKQQGLFPGAPAGSKRYHSSITSPKQVAEYLELCGIELPLMKDKKTREIKKTTNSVWLKPLKDTFKVVELLLEFRELDKRKSSYGAKYCKTYIHPITGRIHSDYDPLGTKTARFSNSKPNLQQIPQLPEYRSCFMAMPEGQVLVGADFSQIELRIAAELSKDPGYIEAFLSGKDFHAATAEFMFGVKKGDKDFDKMRFYAKRINFGIIYGMGANKLALQTGLPESKETLRLHLLERAGIIESAGRWLNERIEAGYPRWEALKEARQISTPAIEAEVYSTDTAQDYLDKYYETFETLMKWLKARGKETAKYCQIRMKSGRLVKFWVIKDQKWSVAQAERNGMNTPIQGLAGEILKISIRLIFDQLCKDGKVDSIRLVHCIHDEIILECLQEDAVYAQELLTSCMLDAGRQFLKVVPVKVDAHISTMWEK